MTRSRGNLLVFLLFGVIGTANALGQIDPVRRQLIQLGYNAALQGHPPLSAYAFYYDNRPGFPQTNLTLRVVVSPTYLDSELGVSHALGTNTDLGFGLAGGGFNDNYYEIRNGKYLPRESFDGYGAQTSVSLYHLFNPGRLIPLYAVVRGAARFVTYDQGADTASDFRVPDEMGIFAVRAGLRWGGREPVLFPNLAMELSIWEESNFRTRSEVYGFSDRQIHPSTHLFWAEAFLAYELPSCKHSFSINLTAGTSIDADRFSAYRIGGFLPMVSEFPLVLPGYFFQEFSAKEFFVAAGTYGIPLDSRQRWNISLDAATALVGYLPGLEERPNWRSGVGGGLFYTTPTWRVRVGYGYGIDAVRSSGRGAHSIGFLLQLDLAPAKKAFSSPEPAGGWRNLQRIFKVLGS